jgi:hypothetical protein
LTFNVDSAGSHEWQAPRWLAWLLRAIWRPFTGQQLDALTLPLPLVVIWLTRTPSDALRIHEVVHVLQCLNCRPVRGPRLYRATVGAFVAAGTWLYLWAKCGFSYKNHPWEIQSRKHAGQE